MLGDADAGIGWIGVREALEVVSRGCEVLECVDRRTEVEGVWGYLLF